jgi:hypothetical protein
MAIRKFKSSRISPIFERLNLERLRKCSQTTEWARRLIVESKQLTQESQELVEKLRKKRKAT